MSEIKTSNLSWTNKDFLEVYPEILLSAKEISPKWDPTISNETDPGIVILKEIALAIDKNNYIADKNALENYPLSATQTETSRAIFNLLGYYPSWYNSTVCGIALSWSGDADTNIVSGSATIPRFTLITNDDSSTTFTLTTPVTILKDKTVEKAEAIEGYIQEVSINGSVKITEDMIDSDNRIYLEDYFVAQNGIYINNYDNNNNITDYDWVLVDNISTYVDINNLTSKESLKIYHFGIDIVTGKCYIEFPTNISLLIGNGLSIKYIVSQGADGSVNPTNLTKFLNSTVYGKENIVGAEPVDIELTSDNVLITGLSVISTGANPETIDESYANYKHTIGTYDTLVTLRDYTNAFFNIKTGLKLVYENGSQYIQNKYAVSNDFVCDRNNDVQTSYKIVTEANGTLFTNSYNEDTQYNSFNLKLFAFLFPESLTSPANYITTFTLYESTDANNKLISDLAILIDKIYSKKCVAHDFKDIVPNKICNLKNYYTVDCRIIPSQVLSDTQKKELIKTIQQSLYNNFNARMVEFGLAINLEQLLQVIKSSDIKIKLVLLENISYETRATFYETASEDNPLSILMDSTYYTYDELEGGSYKKTEHRYTESMVIPVGWKEVVVSDEHPNYLSGYYFNKDGVQGFYYDEQHTREMKYDDKYRDDYLYLDLTKRNNDTQPCNYVFYYSDKKFNLYTTLSNTFRDEIVVKNMLCGSTPAIEPVDLNFQYQINQNGSAYENVAKIKTDREYDFDLTKTTTTPSQHITQATNNVVDNEVIMFSRPTTEVLYQYGNYVKYQYVGADGAILLKNEVHTLLKGEYFTVFYKEDSDDVAYTMVRYGEGCVIRPTFTVSADTIDEFSGFLIVSESNYGSSNQYLRKMQLITDESKLKKIESFGKYLTSTKTLDILQTNIRSLERNNTFWYAITNTKTKPKDINKKELYNLIFSKYLEIYSSEPKISEYIYQLLLDEYFIYTNSDKSSWNVYGSGTVLKLQCYGDASTITWTSDVLDLETIITYRLTALSEIWGVMPSDAIDFSVIEQEYVNILSDGQLTISRSTNDYPVKIKLDSTGIRYMSQGDGRPAYFGTENYDKTNIEFKDINSSGGLIVSKPSDEDTYNLLNELLHEFDSKSDTSGQISMRCKLHATNKNFYETSQHAIQKNVLTTLKMTGITAICEEKTYANALSTTQKFFGTGTTLNLLFKNIVNVSKVIVDGETKTETTDYTVDKTNGKVTLTSAPTDYATVEYSYDKANILKGGKVVFTTSASAEISGTNITYLASNTSTEKEKEFASQPVGTKSFLLDDVLIVKVNKVLVGGVETTAYTANTQTGVITLNVGITQEATVKIAYTLSNDTTLNILVNSSQDEVTGAFRSDYYTYEDKAVYFSAPNEAWYCEKDSSEKFVLTSLKVVDNSESPTGVTSGDYCFAKDTYNTYKAVLSSSEPISLIRSQHLKWEISNNKISVILPEADDETQTTSLKSYYTGIDIIKDTNLLAQYKYSFNYNVLYTESLVDLNRYTIRYKNSGDSSDTTLPKNSSYDKVLSWSTRSYLNLNMSNNTYQKLSLIGLSIKLMDVNGNELGTISPELVDPTKSDSKVIPQYVLCSQQFYMDGSPTDVDVYQELSDGTIKYKLFYSFKKNDLYSDSLVFENNLTISISVPERDTSKLGYKDNIVIPIIDGKGTETQLLQNNYIFKILANKGTINTDYISKMFFAVVYKNKADVCKDWEEKGIVPSEPNSYILKQAFSGKFNGSQIVLEDCFMDINYKTYYIDYPYDVLSTSVEGQTPTLYLFVQYNSDIGYSPKLILNMSYLKAYKNSDLMNSSRLALFNKLNSAGDSSYDLFYEVLDNKLVKNPLASNQFLNDNHFYNPYTICLMISNDITINE